MAIRAKQVPVMEAIAAPEALCRVRFRSCRMTAQTPSVGHKKVVIQDATNVKGAVAA